MTYTNKRWDHIIAMAGTIALHCGVAVWAMMPEETVAIQQQVIQVSMVAPSVVEQTQAQEKPDEVTPVTPPASDGIKVQKKLKKKPTLPKLEKPAKKTVMTPPTSGPQAAEATERLAAVTEPVFNASYLHNPPPTYPMSARKRGVQGKVMLDVSVTREGSAHDVAIARSSGSPLLDEAALDAVRNWRFIPAKRGSEVVEARVLVPVLFKLD